MERTLEGDARGALDRYAESKKMFNDLSKQNIILAANEIEAYLKQYVELHKENKKTNEFIEKRRQDHWDAINIKCKENKMFSDLWNQILILLKLEQENIK